MEQACNINVRFFAPPVDLAPCFTTFYRLELDLPARARVTDYLQPEWANLRFFSANPPDAHILDGPGVVGARFSATGPSSRLTHFTMGRTRMWGVGLLPLGWARYVGVPACDHANTIVDGEVSPIFARFLPLRNALCDPRGEDEAQLRTLVDFFRTSALAVRDEQRIRDVHQALIDPALTRVEEFAERSGLTKRTLERVCLRHFGFPPRLLLRRQRMMRSLAAFMLGKSRNWTEAIDRHYHDQAHFVHEFHSFMSMSPSEYASMPHPIIAAFMSERQRVWGSAVQTLDQPR